MPRLRRLRGSVIRALGRISNGGLPGKRLDIRGRPVHHQPDEARMLIEEAVRGRPNRLELVLAHRPGGRNPFEGVALAVDSANVYWATISSSATESVDGIDSQIRWSPK